MTIERACYLLMLNALNEPRTVLFQSARKATTMRFNCYKMRRALKAADNDKFNQLKFTVKSNTLTVERKHESADQSDV